MKDPIEVLRRKEAELERLRQEIEALRLVGKMLTERRQSDEPSGGKVLQILSE